MLRICFNRKNKTLASEFKTNQVLQTLRHNYLVYCKIKKVEVDEESLDIKSMIDEILTERKMADCRSRTMEIDDFLQLMCAFNQKGIHFV